MEQLSAGLAELIARRFAVLSEPTRVRLLDVMHAAGEASVGELAAAVGASHANVSKHLQLMLGERMVARRREGPRAYYRISDPSLIVLCEAVCSAVRRSLAEVSAIVDAPAVDGPALARAPAGDGPALARAPAVDGPALARAPAIAPEAG